MRIDYINQEIMETLLQGYPVPKYDTLNAPDKETLYIISADGTVAYVLEENEIFFNLARCVHTPGIFKALAEDDTHLRIDNMLEPTLDIRAALPRKSTAADFLAGTPNYRLLTRFKGATWETFVDMDLLEAFDTVTAQTAHHLREMAGSDGRRALGRVVDDLTRTHQATKNNRGGKRHGMV